MDQEEEDWKDGMDGGWNQDLDGGMVDGPGWWKDEIMRWRMDGWKEEDGGGWILKRWIE
jgi:hypothetical protein